MAVKALMLRKKIDGKRSELARLLEKDTELERREAELIPGSGGSPDRGGKAGGGGGRQRL